jgi:hydroxymethylpyrimidine/phosphomethylpyrimidine kinase
MQDECIDYVGRHLFPLCSLVTPNLHEAQVLAGTTLESEKDIEMTGRWLAEHYGTAFLIKGGHIESSEEAATDYLFCNDGNNYAFSSARLHARNLHGTGCTLSSAIASLLAKGDMPLPAAVASAKRFVADAIIRSTSHNIGHGSGPLLTLDPSATERIVQNSLVKWKRMCSKSC